MTGRSSVFIYSRDVERFPYPADCPFKTERVVQTRKTLESMGLLAGPGKKEARPEPAGREYLETFHTAGYLDTLKECDGGRWPMDALHSGIGGPDTPVFKGMYGYGALAAGATRLGADILLSEEADVVFSPSGGLHHAGPGLAAGFCYINDVALACRHLAHNGRKVLYLDIDVHHGDGVQNAFYDRDDVMTVSLHESGDSLYPGTGTVAETGEGKGRGFSVNVPLPAGTYNDLYWTCFTRVMIPLAEAFAPDVVVLEFGADALAGDPLAHLRLTNTVYVKILRFLLGLDTPLLVTGGGGYNVSNTVRAWALGWNVLTGGDQELDKANLGLGGVMLETTDWSGGLQDRELPVTGDERRSLEPVVEETIRRIKTAVFPLHGLS